jgi:hypothetical protein
MSKKTKTDSDQTVPPPPPPPPPLDGAPPPPPPPPYTLGIKGKIVETPRPLEEHALLVRGDCGLDPVQVLGKLRAEYPQSTFTLFAF